MGTVFIAECECGFKSEDLYLGEGMNSRHDCRVPAICLNCSSLMVINYYDKNFRCPECMDKGRVVLYNDLQVQAQDELKIKRPTVFSWNTDDDKGFRLYDIHYQCPRCGKMKMKFINAGFWD